MKNNKLKYFTIILISILTFAPLFGQRTKVLNYSTHDDKPIHFGFCLGFNMMDFVIKPNYPNQAKLIADVSKPGLGFHIQIVSNYRLTEYLDVRFLPGISFGVRTLNFFDIKDPKVKPILQDSLKQSLQSNFLEFPLLLKYKGKRLNNVRPYLITGVNLRYDLASTYSDDSKIYMDLKNIDYYYELGTGLDFYLPYFKLSTEFKVSYGLRNVLNRQSKGPQLYQNSIQRMNSMLYMFSFCFE